MHNYTIHASIQIIPLVTDKHPYEWVDEAIFIIQQSGLKYEIGPFATIFEGKYDEVIKLIHEINEHLLNKNCSEWITNLQMQIRNRSDITGSEKTKKFK